jgi:formylmethanofuran dehydrogenase subunit E
VLIRYFARVIPASLDTVETLIAANMKEQVERMSLAETKYVVFQEHELKKEATESLPDALRRWLVKCPQCTEVRLVVGARENERYVCKDCGHSFTISRTTL